MRFDDRLATVLGHPASSPHDRAIRWRQLVELVARAPADGDRDLVDEALEAIRGDRAKVDERVRSAAALAIASQALPVELVSAFAADRLSVAASILAGARLTASEWKQVAASASEECRNFIASMRSGPAEPAPERPREEPAASIGEVVARIERLRHSREDASHEAEAAEGESPGLFRWECNESGEIDWVEGAPRGALVGRSIAHGGNGSGVDRSVERAFASRTPFHDGLLELPSDAKVGGTWKISGIPAFERSSGRFSGYRGVAERASGDDDPYALAAHADPNSLRELAHEIRTPLNAIVGFAEMISGEYLGPAESRYRERAEEIVAQARLLVDAVDDLDFAARMRSAPQPNRPRIDLGELLESMAPALAEMTSARGAAIAIEPGSGDLSASAEPELVQRLVLRLCGAALERASEGETLLLSANVAGATCRIAVSRPAALAGADESALFGTGDDGLGGGFSLRLVRGLSRVAGASLIVTRDTFALAFPCA